MAKVVDITEKLEFDSNPKLVIKGIEYEVDTDAEVVLKVLGMLKSEGTTPAAIIKMYELIFPEKEREKIAKLKLKFKDFKVVVEDAINLVVGEDDKDKQGE